MGKIAFIFSGQGDQFPGMGRTLAEKYPAAADVFAACDALRPGTSSMCFGGTDDELKETRNTQPCLFAVELATAAALREQGIAPSAVAGFSLGEVAALTYAGYVDLATGFRLVCTRGELMQSAAEVVDSAMAAVVRLDAAEVEALCARHDGVYAVNFNCPGQTTVSGLAGAMSAFSADVKAAGGRALPLKVAGGFHSPFMADAAAKFADALASVDFAAPTVPLYSNVTGEPYGSNISGEPYGSNPADLLSRQICSPVRWEATIRNMIAAGVDTFIEIGPGRTLTNMVGKISTEVRAYTAADLDTILSEVK